MEVEEVVILDGRLGILGLVVDIEVEEEGREEDLGSLYRWVNGGEENVCLMDLLVGEVGVDMEVEGEEVGEI